LAGVRGAPKLNDAAVVKSEHSAPALESKRTSTKVGAAFMILGVER